MNITFSYRETQERIDVLKPNIISIIENHTFKSNPTIPQRAIPHTACLKNIKAIAFDIYGTLLHSAAGEVGTVETTTIQNISFPHLGLILNANTVKDIFKNTVFSIHKKMKQHDTKHPEINSIELWAHILQNQKEFFSCVNAKNSHAIIDSAIFSALYYELAINPVCLMPYAEEILQKLLHASIDCGIVSNAQFYTPITLEALFKNWTSYSFSAKIWSYQYKEAKPSPLLFQKLLSVWKKYKPSEILYVGNDVKNDIAPAQSLHITTTLFAGDSLSYRPRKDFLSLSSVTPDRIITSLTDIPHMLGI